jgi:short subunit dehydrogenase-like uncharacterized protein
MSRKYDVILWGATGFTGRLAVKYLATNYPAESLKWAISGRNISKLNEIKENTAKSCNKNLDHVDVLIADINDKASLTALTSQTVVLLSTAGPFALVGSAVVDACVSSGTNYVDITGEVQWVRKMIDLHNGTAAAKKIKIISCCGFDCIPVDLGTQMVVDNLKAKNLTPIAVKSTVIKMIGGASGGTIYSMMNLFASLSARQLLELLNPFYLSPRTGTNNSLDQPTNKETKRNAADKLFPVYDSALKEWTAPFLMQAVDTRIVNRSNALGGWQYGKDFIYSEGIVTPNVIAAWGVSIFSSFLLMLLYFPFVRTIVKFFVPEPGSGPDVKFLEKGMFEMSIHGTGVDAAGNKQNVFGKVFAENGDAGYVQTAKMVCESAICLAKDQTPPIYGHVTPSVGLGESLRQRLRSRGMDFSIKN